MKILALLFALVFLFPPGAWPHESGAEPAMHMNQAMRGMPNAHPLPGLSIYNLNGYWTTQNGANEPLSALRGKPLVAAMVYTHCRDICPLIVERMQEVERSLPVAKRGSVHFVLFSLDWIRDTPDQLQRFASQHGLESERWALFHGNENAVRELAAALGVRFYKGTDGDIQHSIAIFAIDSDGVVNFEQNDLGKPTAALLAATRKLLREDMQKPPRAQ